MCLRRAPEKYIVGAALDRAALEDCIASYSVKSGILHRYSSPNLEYHILDTERF
jgi:hypothetical protein